MMFKVAAIAALVGSAAAHMAVISPCPRYNPNCAAKPPLPAGQQMDVDIKTPISSLAKPEAVQPLCKYTTPWAAPAATWTAGQSVTVEFQRDGAAHSGGHCQFSMSYDGGKTFAVIHEELRHCFFTGAASSNDATVLQYTFNLPKDLPSSNSAIFVWSWVNASGNREFYMNCADVAIKGTSQSYTGKKMTIANYPGYPTIPEFGGNYDTGLDLYKNQPMITVTGSGNYVQEPIAPPPAVPQNGKNVVPVSSAPAPSAPAPATSSPTPVPNPHVNPTPVAHPNVPTAMPAPPSVPTPAPVPKPAPAPTPVPAPVSSAPAVVKPSLPMPTLPAHVPALPGGCTHGAYQCAASGAAFRICVWGKWSADLACSAGTKCKQSSPTTVSCGWP
ncbi:hypothetical protein IWQ57_000713 [Coemansia nantahalensis]|uniref:Uncharacterized protein n=1 Tax=Coemansia nantahalensis TaxID=2789366 RepID=A0ACC1K710_9FUNG|nr:hypothetical protein IWQ57_000713 [Coemansia nantahalensis]